MRILSVTDQKPIHTGSGVYLTELVRAFDRRGIKQAVAGAAAEEDEVRLPDGAGFFPVRFRTEKLPFDVVGMSDEMPYDSTRYRDLTEAQKECFLEAFRETVTDAVKSIQPDLILCHHLYLLTAHMREWFPDRRIFGICHGSDLRQYEKNSRWREEIRQGIRSLDGIFALHGAQADKIRELFFNGDERTAKEAGPEDGADSRPAVSVVGSGFDDQIFYASKTVVFAGKITEKKGVYSLFRALERLPYADKEIRLVLAGEFGSERDREEITRLADSVPYETVFTGRLSHEELAEAFRAADVFVLPSFSEGLPLVLMEALACGLKTVCTDLPGIREWADANIPGHGIRFVQPPRFSDADEPFPEDLPSFEAELAEAVLETAGDPGSFAPDMRALTWDGAAERILRACKV